MSLLHNSPSGLLAHGRRRVPLLEGLPTLLPRCRGMSLIGTERAAWGCTFGTFA